MSHETLQALYALDVAEVGDEEAAKRWEVLTVNNDEEEEFATVEYNGYPMGWLGKEYRRKPGIPWPKKIQPDLAAYKTEINRLQARLNQEQPKQEWPADAPEWANYMAIDGDGQHKIFSNKPLNSERNNAWVSGGGEYLAYDLACPNWRDSLVERPKPPTVKKIDWSKVPYSITRMLHPEHDTNNPLTGWIAWNCDENTKGSPLPDGLVVEFYDMSVAGLWKYCSQLVNWNNVTRFRIVGIQEGWE